MIQTTGERGKKMDPILYNKRLQSPIYTGTVPQAQQNKGINKSADGESTASFQEILKQKVSKESRIEFSKHAMDRVVQRNVNVSTEHMERLNEGVKLAEEKGLKEPLILVDSTAFVVSVKNNKVITVVSDENLKGTVFTNIDGTVMI